MSGSDATAVQFKKRRRVNNNPRASTIKTEDQVAGVDNEEIDAIEDTRILQEERKRRLGGLKRSTVADASSSVANASSASSTSTVNAAQDLANLVTKEGAFTSAFERQTDAPDQASKIEKLMDQYVNEQLAAEKRKWHEQALASAQAKRGAVDDVAKSSVALADSGTATQDKVAHRGTIEAELYALLPSAASGASVVAGAWAAGIEEVELPLDYKIRNIDETAKATHELELRRQRQQPVDNKDRVPKNFSSYSASFSKYHANANNSVLLQTAEQRRAEEQTQPQQGQQQQQQQHHAQTRQATDFKAMS